MNNSVTQITNERDACRLQLEGGGGGAGANGSDGVGADGSETLGVLAQKNEEIAKMRSRIQSLQMIADVATEEEVQRETVRHCLCLAFPPPSRAKTAPLPRGPHFSCGMLPLNPTVHG